MNKPNRDLLVMLKQELYTPQAMEQEVSFLHELLFTVERSNSVVLAHEVININKFKISTKSIDIKNALKNNNSKPFVFLNNRN